MKSWRELGIEHTNHETGGMRGRLVDGFCSICWTKDLCEFDFITFSMLPDQREKPRIVSVMMCFPCVQWFMDTYYPPMDSPDDDDE